ncbi:MAG: V-type ATPase subunit [Candidatus Undinarchaeales archaeon]|jgi:V/A-type H+-transporting ATPase subunit C|nr:V-type ATPase subunit [Candidatus Undinarchaeales archaeon]MDP7492162.1 V-type ATPase subunit [Candidatus Undinarchaeales archaeon]
MLLESFIFGSGAVLTYLGLNGMEDSKYAYGLGRVRALENRLLRKARIDELVETSTHLEVLKALGDSSYSQDLRQVREWRDFDLAADKTLLRTYVLVRSLLPEEDRVLVDVLQARHDLHNLHAVVRGKLQGRPPDHIERTLSYAGTLSEESLATMAKAEELDALPGLVGDTGYAACLERTFGAITTAKKTGTDQEGPLSTYAPYIIRHGGSDKEVEIDPQHVAYALDTAFFALLNTKLSESMGRRADLARNILKSLVDVQNLKTLVRAHLHHQEDLPKEAFMPSGTIHVERFHDLLGEHPDAISAAFSEPDIVKLASKAASTCKGDLSVSAFERACDNALLQGARERTLSRTLSPDPIITYALMMEREAVILKMIFHAKFENMDKEKLHGVVRDVYV